MACLESVSQFTYDHFSVMVIDNGSEGSARKRFLKLANDHGLDLAEELLSERIRRPPRDGEVVLVTTGNNLGYAGGNNCAFRCAIAWKFDWILVLNNDTTVPEDLLVRMVASGVARARIGLVGCKVVPSGTSNAHTYEGGRLLYGLGVYALHRWHGRQGTISVNFVPGCAVLVRRQLLDEIGMFDERFFLYTEDVDLSYRGLRSGWELLVNLDVAVKHDLSASLGGRRSSSYYYYVTRNTLLFIWMRLPVVTRISSTVFFLVQTAARCGFWFFTGRFRHIRAALSGMADALYGKRGERPV
jgi:GT2 family glycosyltransferase